MWWGLTNATNAFTIRGWGIDNIGGLPVLSELHNLVAQPKDDWYVAYPLAHYIILGLLYLPAFGYFKLTGTFGAPSSEYPFGFSDPVSSLALLEWLARIVNLAMTVGVLMALYLAIKTLWGRRAGILGIVGVMLAPQMVYYARVSALDIPALFWTSLGLLIAARSLRDRLTAHNAAWLGAFAAMAVASKDQAYGAWVFGLLVILFAHFRDSRGAENPSDRWRPPVVLAGSGLIVFLVAGGVLLFPARFMAHVKFIRNFENTFVNVQLIDKVRPATIAGYLRLLMDAVNATTVTLGIVLAVTGVIGVLVYWRRDRFARLLVMMAIGHLMLVILPVRHAEFRYLLFPSIVLAIFAGLIISEGLAHRGLRRALALTASVVGFGWLGLNSIDLTYQMLFDARYDAGKWLAAHTQPGDRVVFFGGPPQPPKLPVGVIPVPMPLDTLALEKLGEEPARFVLVLPDWSSGPYMERSRLMPEQVYRDLKQGALGYARVAKFERRPLLGRRHRYLTFINPPVQIFSQAR
jgi:hypothetical protein